MRKLLLPISLIYYFVLFIRHKFFDWDIIKSRSYKFPIIGVGNLALGGTGKTPHTEYLIHLLSKEFKIAVLSRGYGRKTKGFILANKNMSHTEIGDEPLQYLHKFNDIEVAVDKNRCEGVEKLMQSDNPPQVILLDDAFQHRKIKPGYNILVTDYHKLYKKDLLFPAGNLRDIKRAAERADAIIISKSPSTLSPYQIKYIENIIKPLPHQKIFYSYIKFQDFSPLSKKSRDYDVNKSKTILLFCGIANLYHLEDYLKRKYNTVSIIRFSDHHNFTEKDIDHIIEKYNSLIGKNKIIITTEKDAMRLINSSYLYKFDDIPLFTIPIKMKFHSKNKIDFNHEILNYVRKNS